MDLKFAWNEEIMSMPNFIISASLIVIFLGVILYVFLRVTQRKAPIVFISLSLSFTLLTFLFALFYPFVLFCALDCVVLVVTVILNQGDFNKFISNPFSKASAKNVNFGVEKIFDRNAMYSRVNDAVQVLSSTRTGAIITFERNKSLKDVIVRGNGVTVNAPVTAELLLTIFYPGTRLHDGAVVICGDKIAAAAVFYEPTKKIFASKYGSRHRAAIGISELSDAVTVVVSEETGRISFAINGQIEIVEPSNFLNAFKTYMADETNE